MTEQNTADFKVIVAIDLGTHGTGYAWAEKSALNESLSNRQIHFQSQWRGFKDSYPKNLSALLLDPDGEVAEWGFEARTRWQEVQASDGADGWGYAYAFKMALKAGGGPDVSTTLGAVDLTDPNTAVRLTSAYLSRLKDEVLAEVSGSGWAMRHIRWCITVPAIWGDAEHTRVREAASAAGLPGDDHDRLLVAVEPEAAAVYCSRWMVKVLDGDGSEDRLVLANEGTRFMVVDCGGGTVDLSAHRTVRRSSGEIHMVEIGRPLGGKLGSEYVNHAFRTVALVDALGADVVADLERRCPTGLAELVSSWESEKIVHRAVLDDGRPTVSSKARMTVPGAVWALLSTAIQERLSAESNGITHRLILGPEQVQALFDVVVDEILERVEEELAEMRRVTESAGGEVLLLVGGFARSEYLRLRIRERFADRTTVLVPPDPAIAVLFGAVQYGYNPDMFVSRRSRLTYGFAVAAPFEDGVDPPEKHRKIDGQRKCFDRFEIAARNGESIDVDEPYYFVGSALTSDSREVELRFYATDSLDPRYVDEHGCMQIGSLTCDLSDSVGQPADDRAVALYMYFGRTEIQAEAKVLSTGVKVDTRLEFRTRY